MLLSQTAPIAVVRPKDLKRNNMKPHSLYSIGLGLLAFCLATIIPGLVRGADVRPEPRRELGILTGTVSNDATGAFLEGAEVKLGPNPGSVLTTRDGRFVIPSLPAGDYVLTVAYTGLDTKTVPVNVKAGGTSAYDIALTAEIYKLSTFVVEGEREGNALAITQQRNAANVKNVVSSDAFGNVADLNIGNFLQRLPGFSTEMSEGEIIRVQIRGTAANLNAISVDGTRTANGTSRTFERGADIDRISADFIETIEVTKAMTPDLDADSIGGSVNLKTKSALDRKGRRITYNFGQNYNPAQGTFRPLGNVGYSNLFLGGKLGVLITASYNESHKPRDYNAFHWEPSADLSRPAWFNANAFGQDQLRHQRAGAGVRLDYKLSDQTKIYFSTNVSMYEDQLNRRWARLASPAAASIVSATTDVTETRNHTFLHYQLLRNRDVATANFMAGGESSRWGGKLDFNVSYSWSEGGHDQLITPRTVAGTGFRQVREGNYIHLTQISGPDIMDWRNSVLNGFDLPEAESHDRISGAQINFRRPIPAVVPLQLKTGARFRDQTRDRDNTMRRFNYVGPNGVAGPVGAANDDNLERFYDPGYFYTTNDKGVVKNADIPPRFMNIWAVRDELHKSPELFREDFLVGTRDSIINDSTASESVAAAYVMGDMQLGRLGVVGGVRVEETRLDGEGYKREITAAERARRSAWVGTVTPEETVRRAVAEYGNQVTGSARYHDYFPSVHFKYRFAENLIARASFSTGIGRPNFSQIVPAITVDTDNLRVTANNPELRPQYSDNWDATLEYYFKPAGLLSAAIFQKKLTNFIYRRAGGVLAADNPFGDAYEGYTFTSDFNGGTAKIRGLEASYQQQFTNLPGLWRGLGAYANFTWLESSGEYRTPGESVTQSELPNFRPRSGNVGLSYIAYAWTIRVMANYSGPALATFANNPAERLYRPKAMPVDLNVAYTISPRLRLYVDVINVFDAARQDTYKFIPDRPDLTLLYTPVIKFGISGSF